MLILEFTYILHCRLHTAQNSVHRCDIRRKHKEINTGGNRTNKESN